jgi:hypothetical protein
VVGAVLGQPPDGNVDVDHPELGGAFAVARAAVDVAFTGYAPVLVGAATVPVSGRVFGAWGTAAALHLAGADTVVLLRRGETLAVQARRFDMVAPLPAGAAAATVTVSRGGTSVGTWTLALDSQLSAPSPWWRLLHG